MKYLKLFVFMILVVLIGGQVHAEEPIEKNKWHGGLRIGLSHYTGVLGAEFQKGHYAFTLGIPYSLGVKYYTNEEGRKWFFGINTMKYNLDDYEAKDGLVYDNLRHTEIGGGIGYKWRSKKYWEFTLGLSLQYVEEELNHPIMSRTNHLLWVSPDISIGFNTF